MRIDTDVAWLAGLIEGEGSFMVKRVRPDKEWWGLTIQIGMTDQDVIDRVAALCPGGHINVDAANESRRTKPLYRWRMTNRPLVVELAQDVLPYLGGRRSAEALNLLWTAKYASPRSTQ